MANKNVNNIVAAEEAAKGQELALERHRDLYICIGEHESMIKQMKQEMAWLENDLDFSKCFEETKEKATGRLRLSDNSYQLTKTVSIKTVVTPDMNAIMADDRVHKALEPFIRMVPTLDVPAAMQDAGAKKILAEPFALVEEKEATRYTCTVNPRG